MKVSRYRGKWCRRVLRVSPAQRRAVVEIATALNITVDGVCRLALRAYAGRRGQPLGDFRPVAVAKAQGFIPCDDSDKPRVWMRFRESWEAVVHGLFVGECNTFGGVVRESISEFHTAGPDAWRAAMADKAATETKGSPK